MSEDKRQRMGAQIDKKEKTTMESITRLEPKIANLLTDMEKSAAMKKPELKEYPRLVRECFQDIQTIIRKKNLLFKVNDSLEMLINNTSEQAEIIKRDLGVAGETKFLCCGTE